MKKLTTSDILEMYALKSTTEKFSIVDQALSLLDGVDFRMECRTRDDAICIVMGYRETEEEGVWIAMDSVSPKIRVAQIGFDIMYDANETSPEEIGKQIQQFINGSWDGEVTERIEVLNSLGYYGGDDMTRAYVQQRGELKFSD